MCAELVATPSSRCEKNDTGMPLFPMLRLWDLSKVNKRRGSWGGRAGLRSAERDAGGKLGDASKMIAQLSRQISSQH